MKVVIFAWMLCKPRHLQKIASFWQSRNIEPIQIFSPPKELFFPYWYGSRGGAKVASMLSNTFSTDKPERVFFHAFSGQVIFVT
jgi:hypothetical protein